MNTTPQKDLSSTPSKNFLLITLGYYIPEKEHMEADIKSIDLGNLEYGYLEHGFLKLGIWNISKLDLENLEFGEITGKMIPRIVHKLA